MSIYYGRILFLSTSPSMTKKTTKGDRHAMLKVIQHGVMIAEFRYLQENCRHCDWKFDRIGDHVICHV
jgi:hypothetical protein